MSTFAVLERVRVQIILFLLACAATLGCAGTAAAQTPVRILVGFAAGGGVDVVARVLAEHLEKQTGRPHLVENKTGAAGSLPARALVGAPADGSTLMLAPDSVVLVFPHTVAAPGFNPLTDLIPISRVTSYDFALSVGVGDGAPRSLEALRDAARTNPKGVTIANPGAGGLLHFYSVAVAKATGMEATHVPYRGVAPAITDTIGGAVTALLTPVGPVLPHAEAGRLRLLATSGAERGVKTPGIPTFKELGYPELVSGGWFGLFAPAKTPPDVVHRLQESIRLALADPAVRSKLVPLEMEASWNSSKDFRAQVEAESRTWSAVIKASGFKADQ